MNLLSVPSAVRAITLSINIEGKWNLPDNSNSTNSILIIPNFSSQNNGIYKFFVNNWSGIEVCAIQINLITTTAIKGAYVYNFLNLVTICIYIYIYIYIGSKASSAHIPSLCSWLEQNIFAKC